MSRRSDRVGFSLSDKNESRHVRRAESIARAALAQSGDHDHPHEHPEPARGLVAIGSATSSIEGITTETTVVTISNVPFKADRQYVLHGHLRTSSDSGSGDAAQMTCYFVGAPNNHRALVRDATIGQGSGGWSTLEGESVFPYSPNSDVELDVTMTLQSSGGGIRLNASSGARAVLKVYDVGPA